MLIFDEDLDITSLPADVFKELVNELDRNSSWRLLGQCVVKELDCFGNENSWIEKFEQNRYSTNQSPAEKLLFELHTRMCTVGILSSLLETCGLLKALSILSAPEPLVILWQPNVKLLSDTIEVTLSQQLKLTCKAVGMPPPDYLWYHGKTPLSDHITEDLKMKITNVNQEGDYKCKIYQSTRDGCVTNEIFSESVAVTIKLTAVIIRKQPQTAMYIKEGEKLILSCEAESHPIPQFQWFRDNTKLDVAKNHSENDLNHKSKIISFLPNDLTLCGRQISLLGVPAGQRKFSVSQLLFRTGFKIDKFSEKDEGKYYCHVFNKVSEAFTQRSYVMIDLPRQKATAKIALLIANEDYQYHTKLNTPKADVTQIAKILEDIGFTVICLINLTLVEMRNAVRIFSETLSEGVYGLFYFAGHGFKMQESYMLPTDVPEVYLRSDAICESQLLSLVLKNDPALFVTILDICQTVPSKEVNPVIHKEIPLVNEYKGRKNLRNLIQAYSTSSHRPSYEQSDNKNGVYAKYLSKFLDRDIPINKVFEEVGKSIDTWLKGKARNQIPMFSSTITKPFRLTDSTSDKKLPPAISNINELISFPEKIVNVNFEKCDIKSKVLVSAFMKPFLNVVRVSLFNLEDYDVNFYNSVPTEKNDLYQNLKKKECWIYNPQFSKGPLVICLLKNGVPIGATLLNVIEFIPALLHQLK